MEMKEGKNVMSEKGLFLMVDQRMCGGSGTSSVLKWSIQSILGFGDDIVVMCALFLDISKLFHDVSDQCLSWDKRKSLVCM